MVLLACGCEVDSFLNPSRTGYFEHMPTTIPILDRLDVIETQDQDELGQTTPATAEDLVPSDLSYLLSPGDMITVQIYELYQTGQWHVSTRRIDAGGFFRLPEIGDVQAAGMNAQDFEDRVSQLLHEHVMPNPLVDVVVEEGGGFTYTLYGAVQAQGLYSLRRPDLRLLDALAIAGGVPLNTESIYVVRQVPLTDVMKPSFERPQPAPADKPPTPDIEELLRDLDRGGERPRPGVLRQQGEPMIDVDELLGPGAKPQPQEPPATTAEPPAVQPLPRGGNDTFIYDEQRGQWVRVRSRQGADAEAEAPEVASAPRMVVERVIEVPYQNLKRGEGAYNIVVRPDDRIYVRETRTGFVYLEGEVVRPGVYNIPFNSKLTLSRLVAAAGGLGPVAIPQRIDLVRVVAPDREAAIRLDLAAIRNRTEPDVYLKPDDHIIVGTNFWATPLAVVRGGFRATYGFGFLLDRNFGNDVFGAPPTNQFGQ